jgi:SAM-dependent methyltransferase
MGWRDVAEDPYSAEAKAYRDAVLQRAFMVERRTRADVLVDLCRGRRVIDLGCVGNSVAEMHDPSWLHGRLAAVATEIVGLDIDQVGVKAMRGAGYDVIEADISGDISVISARGQFDVVIAGELIEHLDAPTDLFRFSARILRPEGILVITTPNPYSPVRGRRGAHRETWESADHVAYFPPTGIAELAERAGMNLTMATTVRLPHSRQRLMRPVRRLLRRDQELLPQDELSLLDALIYRLRGSGGQLGESAIFVVTNGHE